MPREQKETNFAGKLYMEKERDGTRKEVAAIDDIVPANIEIAADVPNGLSANNLQDALEELAARIQALEDAP